MFKKQRYFVWLLFGYLIMLVELCERFLLAGEDNDPDSANDIESGTYETQRRLFIYLNRGTINTWSDTPYLN